VSHTMTEPRPFGAEPPAETGLAARRSRLNEVEETTTEVAAAVCASGESGADGSTAEFKDADGSEAKSGDCSARADAG
jgi:hypothetical protein